MRKTVYFLYSEFTKRHNSFQVWKTVYFVYFLYSKFTKRHNSLKIVAAFRGMHVSPASVTDGRTDRRRTK